VAFSPLAQKSPNQKSLTRPSTRARPRASRSASRSRCRSSGL
jgi:hypothetical protein